MLYDDYIKYLNSDGLKKTNPRDLQRKREPTLMLIGKYYQCFHRKTNLNDMLNWYKMKHIMQHRPTFGIEEAEATYKYMLEDTFITEHKKTVELENMICKYIGCKHCIMTTSGTCAIMLALMALDLNEGDEVIVPNYTMIATINAVKFLKLKPIIVDVDKDTFTLNIDDISDPLKIGNNYIRIKLNDKKELTNHIDINKELEKLINSETNRQLSNFSIIFYKRLKKNIEINEY